jgi:deazaflavin-dependent oxidoreductase (nitroreductase family)
MVVREKMGAVTNRRDIPIIRAGAALLGIRWVVRAPIWLFRARMGVVFGPRLLMLEHVGRVSGRARYVVLELVDHPAVDRYVVVSGFGEHAQWFRNVEANSRVRIYVASHKPVSAVACRLDADDSAGSLRRYAAAHPRAWAKLRPILEQTLGELIDERGTELPMIAIDLVGPGMGSSAFDR